MSRSRRPEPARRTFLKAMGGVLGAGVWAGTPRRAAGSTRSGPADVLVIGGGFAGVTAARELGHAGLRVLLLEARHRLGGRTFAARVGDELFELGGMWVHSTQPHVWAEVNRYGLELVETPEALPDRVLWWNGESVKEAGWLDVVPLVRAALCASPDDATPDVPRPVLQTYVRMDRLLSDFHAEAPRVFPRPFDPFFSDAWHEADRLSIRERLDQMDLSRDARALLEGVLGAAAHGPFDEAGFVEMLRWWALSGTDLQRYSDSVARYRLQRGTSSLLQAILDEGRPEVRLGTVVARVAQRPDGVEVTTARGEVFSARAAVVAVPLNVLATVEFSPPLDPDKVAVSKQRHAARGIKFYARLRGAIPPVLAFAPEGEPFSTLMTAHVRAEETLLLGFGTDPARLDVHRPEAVQAAIRRFLPDAEVTGTHAYDWHLDPYARGTWCIFRKGQMSRYLRSLRAPEGRVHFAGGDLALGWRGTIDGAIESGTRVAQELVARLHGREEAGAAGPLVQTGAIGAPAAPPASRECAVCHPVDASGRPGVGPNLHGVVGRPAASDRRFAYSPALRQKGIVWSEAELDAFLANPQSFAPGTTMPFAGLQDPDQRAAVIRWLQEQR